MSLLRRLTIAEQAAAHLRTELERGLRIGTMFGANQLAIELGVDPNLEPALSLSLCTHRPGAGPIVPPSMNSALIR